MQNTKAWLEKAAYFIIKEKVEYKELGEDYLNNFRKDKLIEYHN